MPFGFTASNCFNAGQRDKGKHGKSDPPGVTEDRGFGLLVFWPKLICGRADPDAMNRAQIQMASTTTTLMLAPKSSEQCRGERLSLAPLPPQKRVFPLYNPQCAVTNLRFLAVAYNIAVAESTWASNKVLRTNGQWATTKWEIPFVGELFNYQFRLFIGIW